MGNSAVIINVRVVPAGKGAELAPFARYLGLREGAMREQTSDDLLLKQRVNLEQMAGYYGQRPGALRENGSALFDRDGALGVAAARRRFGGIRSSAVMMTVSVRNEDAALFGLETRQDWERLARANVDRYIASTGAIALQDIEYACAAHINAKSHHVHVVAWDASGAWQGKKLPKARMVAANDALRDQVTAPAVQRLSAQRTAARDELVRGLASCIAANEGLLRRAKSLLPPQGRISYEHLCKNHPAAADEIRELAKAVVSEDARLLESKNAFLTATRGQGRAKGLRGEELDKHASAAVADLEKRCANVLIRAAKQEQAETLRPAHTPSPNVEVWHDLHDAPVRESMGRDSHGLSFTPLIPTIPAGLAAGCGGSQQRRKRKRAKQRVQQL